MLGKVLDEVEVKKGLRELCADIHFDAATKQNAWHPFQAVRQGVFFHGQHICAMDRGMIPEYKQWSLITKYVPVGWEEADKDDVSINAEVIRPESSDFLDAALHVMNRDLGWEYRQDGAIIRMTPMAYRKVQGRVVQVGWRHTFEALLRRDLPNITRRTLAEKFSVDMLKYPVGAPMVVARALLEE